MTNTTKLVYNAFKREREKNKNMEEFDRKDLKIRALLEKISSLTTQYENEVANLRVDLTIMKKELEQAREQLKDTTDVEEKQDPEATSDNA